MSSPNQWHVGAIYSDGSHGIVSGAEGGGGTGIGAESIDQIIFPVSRPWSDRADLYPAPLRLTESHERNMGSEDHYRAHVEDSGPDDQHWNMTLEYVEYENPLVLRLTHSDNVTYADWDPDDLRDAMSNRF